MKINFLGDSITEGACATASGMRYSSLACQMLGAEENNYGIGGTRIAKQKNPTGKKINGKSIFTNDANQWMNKLKDLKENFFICFRTNTLITIFSRISLRVQRISILHTPE